MGDASLKTILRGHTASAFFMSGLQLVMAAWRRALKLGTISRRVARARVDAKPS